MSAAHESEFAHFKNAINTAFYNNEPDSLYYHFKDQLWDAKRDETISHGEWCDLMNILDLWWDGRSLPNREGRWDC